MINKFKDWLNEENLSLLEEWSSEGCSLKSMAGRIGVKPNTLKMWIDNNEQVKAAYESGRKIANDLVVTALFDTALKGSFAAQSFWLRNRLPDEWKERVETENVNKNIDNITLVIE